MLNLMTETIKNKSIVNIRKTYVTLNELMTFKSKIPLHKNKEELKLICYQSV